MEELFRAFLYRMGTWLKDLKLWKLDTYWLSGCGTERHKPVLGRESSTQATSIVDDGQAPAH